MKPFQKWAKLSLFISILQGPPQLLLSAEIRFLPSEIRTCDYGGDNFSDISTWAKDILPTQSHCQDYELGDRLIVEGDSGTGIEAAYSISKTGAKEFTLGLNIQFIGEEKSTEKMKLKLQKCFSHFNQKPKKYFGPLSLVLELDPDAPPIEVKLVEGLDRSNTESWSTEANCRTIIHESFHYTGLVDEYPETILGPYPCRSIGPENSIMNGQSTIARAQNPLNDFLYFCFAPILANTPAPQDFAISALEETALMKKALSHYDQEGNLLPAEGDSNALSKELCSHPGHIYTRVPFDGTQGQSPAEFLNTLLPKENFKTVILNPSLEKVNFLGRLYGGQLRTILYPGCQEKNHLYYSCIKGAYQSGHLPHFLSGKTILSRLDQSQCPQKPPECSSISWVEN